MASPELRNWKIEIGFSAAAIVEYQGKILLVKEDDGYGPPAGHLEGNEWLYPKSGLFWELAEETDVSPSFDMSLWGVMIKPSLSKMSIGLIYKLNKCHLNNSPITDPEIISRDFFDEDEVRKLLSERQIRKAKWNIPVLEAWLNGDRFIFKLLR